MYTIDEMKLFKVYKSEYLKWISSQSYNIVETENLTYFFIVVADSIIDIIAEYESKIEICKQAKRSNSSGCYGLSSDMFVNKIRWTV